MWSQKLNLLFRWGMALSWLWASVMPISASPQFSRPLGPTADDILIDQMVSRGESLISSQNFEPALDNFDSVAADDFTVPAGGWTIRTVEVIGSYSFKNGPVDSIKITVYQDASGQPGAEVYTNTIVPSSGANTGSFVIGLPDPLTLPEGHYWLSAQANLNFDIGGQWAWQESGTQNGLAYVWRNPGNGFGANCGALWCRAASAGVVDYDLMFRLSASQFNPLPAPTGFLPNIVAGNPLYTDCKGADTGGASLDVIVQGTGFVASSVISKSNLALNTQFLTSNQLKTNLNESEMSQAINVEMTVANPIPGGGESNPLIFCILPNPGTTATNHPLGPLKLTSLVPTSIAFGMRGFKLAIQGSGFSRVSKVLWNSDNPVDIRDPIVVSPNLLLVDISAADVVTVGTGIIKVYNTTPVLGPGLSAPLTFLITDTNPAPTLLGITPSFIAPHSPTFTLTLTGTNFIPGGIVNWVENDLTTTLTADTVTPFEVRVTMPMTFVNHIGYAFVSMTNPTPGGGLTSAGRIEFQYLLHMPLITR